MSDQPDRALDRELLGLYLSDHLTELTVGRARLEQMCQAHSDLPIHEDLVRTRDELRAEVDRLREMVDRMGTRPRRARQAAAWVGEKVGRLKLNRRVASRSPMTPLIELELLRGVITANQSLWQVLEEYAEPLGLDAAEFARRARDADEQRERLGRMHGQLRPSAFWRE